MQAEAVVCTTVCLVKNQSTKLVKALSAAGVKRYLTEINVIQKDFCV